MSKTRKNYARGWKYESPNYAERTKMLRRCGKKCFLGSKKSYPICRKNTCKICSHGVYSAYLRASQYRKKTIAKKAYRLWTKMNK
jgi:hypothetical protein